MRYRGANVLPTDRIGDTYDLDQLLERQNDDLLLLLRRGGWPGEVGVLIGFVADLERACEVGPQIGHKVGFQAPTNQHPISMGTK